MNRKLNDAERTARACRRIERTVATIRTTRWKRQIANSDVILDVAAELEGARRLHAPMASPHEAYAVILEELDEAWDEIKKKVCDPGRIRHELVQVAAMAIRAIQDLRLKAGSLKTENCWQRIKSPAVSPTPERSPIDAATRPAK